jgi:hypothetical protein
VTSPTSLETAEVLAAPSGSHDSKRLPSGRRRKRVLVGVVLVVAAGAVLGITDPFRSSSPAKSATIGGGVATSVASVTRQDLSSQTQVAATLGYAGSYSAVNQAQGTMTSLPSVGQIVAQGQVLYGVSGNPVVLLYGSTPAYRNLSEGASASDVTGADVQELNADLVALGYVTASELSPTSNEFSYWTKVGVEKVQAALGVTQNGTRRLGPDRDIDYPPGDHCPRRRPAVRDQGWREGDGHPAQQSDHPGGGVLGGYRRRSPGVG